MRESNIFVINLKNKNSDYIFSLSFLDKDEN